MIPVSVSSPNQKIREKFLTTKPRKDMSKNSNDIGDYIFFFIVGVIICALLSAMF